eukprot:1187442-Rhodomonas_salina.1
MGGNGTPFDWYDYCRNWYPGTGSAAAYLCPLANWYKPVSTLRVLASVSSLPLAMWVRGRAESSVELADSQHWPLVGATVLLGVGSLKVQHITATGRIVMSVINASGCANSGSLTWRRRALACRKIPFREWQVHFEQGNKHQESGGVMCTACVEYTEQ